MNKITTKSTFKSWMETINNLIDSLSSKLGVSDNAVSATKAEQDSLGNVITDTYATKEKVSDLPVIKENIDELASLEDGLYWVKNSSVDYDVFGRLPLGHIFTWPFSTPPDGSIIANGSEYSRELYSDLWTYVNQHLDWIKTEEEWQQIASSNNGYCSYYSTGDGTTTFRTPKFSPFQQLALSLDTVGTYHEAGLPNITGTIRGSEDCDNYFACGTVSGAFARDYLMYRDKEVRYTDLPRPGDGYYGETFDASRSSDKYGKSNTVQPESSEWIVCIAAYGTISNTGNTDVANVMSAVSQVQSNPNLQGAAYIVETWIGDKQSYIKYSNGVADIFMQSATSEAGVVVTLPIEIFEHYSISVTPTLSGTAVTSQVTELSSSTTVGVFISRLDNYQGVACGFTLRVCGRWK